MFTDHQNDTSDFTSGKATAIVKAHGVEPHLGTVGIPLDVNMRRLIPIPGEEEKAIGTDAENSGHGE